MTDYIVVLITASSEEEARKIATVLLEKKLIACANLVQAHSLYVWQGEVQDNPEVLMILKTTSAVFKDKLVDTIRETHSYQVPEIIGMPIVIGWETYLQWISDEIIE